MGIVVTTEIYCNYLQRVSKKLKEIRDYVTQLDAATGDGDHWANLNQGFDAVLAMLPEFEDLPLGELFKKIGMLMMSKVGGSSGVLYGNAYLAASKAVSGSSTIDSRQLCGVLEAMAASMMERGKAAPGYKTMIDAIYPAAEAYKKALADGMSDTGTMRLVKGAALAGAEATRNMEAVKGRASYQTDKGVGHLDPGAVTMACQIECLCDTILDYMQ